MTHRANEKQDERACAECAPNDLKKLVDLSDQSKREEQPHPPLWSLLNKAPLLPP